MTSDLIREVFLPALGNPRLEALGDAARLDPVPGGLAMTTDAFVVTPQDFPGGDIGALAVFGTVNDLAVSGARPVAISAAFIPESTSAFTACATPAASATSSSWARRVGAGPLGRCAINCNAGEPPRPARANRRLAKPTTSGVER